MGGEETEVTASTSRVLLESAHFPPAVVRDTMRRLGMSTEGGQRWARGVDPGNAAPTADRAAALIAGLAGGQVATGRLTGCHGPARPGGSAPRPTRPSPPPSWRASAARSP
jgi:phenylalanyl-tRNA synthetase beta chain